VQSFVIRVLTALLGTALLAGGVLLAIGELSGEVVILHTQDQSGRPYRTRLWVIEHEDASWLRAGGRATASTDSWYARLVAHPEVNLEREDRLSAYRAVPVPEAREVINHRMREAYPLADRVVRSLRGMFAASDDTSMPIRLDPVHDSSLP
jgi:hypothetical protein